MADMWNIGGALLGGLLGNQSSTQSTSNTQQPYAPAQPWIQSNINSGQNLQKQYQANPLSAGQIGAYGNSLGLTQGFRDQAGDLIQQMNSMKQFDRNNPTGKATQFNFTSAPQSSNVQNSLLSSLPAQSVGLLADNAMASALNRSGSNASSGYTGSGSKEVTKGWYETTTPEERAQFFSENPTLAWISKMGINLWNAANPYGLASMQNPAQTAGYLAETTGQAPASGSHYNGNYGNYGSNYGNDQYSMGPSQTNQADTSGWGTPTNTLSNSGYGSW
jgi:hypothetical protein